MKAVLEERKRKREEKAVKKNVSNQRKKLTKTKAQAKKRCRKNQEFFDSDTESDSQMEKEICDNNCNDDMPELETQGEQCLICDEFGRDGYCGIEACGLEFTLNVVDGMNQKIIYATYVYV